MSARGWRIDGFRQSRLVDGSFPRTNADVRANIWHASHGRPAYHFYAATTLEAEASEPGEIRSRYVDQPDVRIDRTRVPEPLRPLLRYARDWAIMDDVERSRFIAAAPDDQKRAFIRAVTPLFGDIEAYARAQRNAVPVPDEVTVLNLMAEAADTASHDVND